MNESNGSEKSFALLLDDNLMSSMRIGAQLERSGYGFETRRALPIGADSELAGSEAIPELVVINLGSRGMPGTDLISACRARYPAARVVGFCGHLEIEIRRAAKAAGIDKILTNDQAYTDLQNSL